MLKRKRHEQNVKRLVSRLKRHERKLTNRLTKRNLIDVSWKRGIDLRRRRGHRFANQPKLLPKQRYVNLAWKAG